MMGERQTDQPALFYEFSFERHVPGGSPTAVDRPVRGSRRHPRAAAAVLQRYGPALDRSGADDPDADRRLLRASARSGGCATRFTSTWPIVGSAGWAWTAPCRTTRPSPRTGTAAFARAICCGELFETTVAALHRRGAGRRRRLRCRCQHDQGRRQPSELDARATSGSHPTTWPCASRISGRARRSGVRRRDAGRAQVHRDRRSGVTLDRREWRARLLRVLRTTI